MAELTRDVPQAPWPERWLTLRQQLAVALLLAIAAAALGRLGLAWLDARTPDPSGRDGTTVLLDLLALLTGWAVGWAILARIERRVADLAVYAAALAGDRPAMLRPSAPGALGDLAAGLNGVAARLGTQAERMRALDEQRSGLMAPLREAAAQEERNRLARELHDTIKQQLFSIGVTAAAAEARWASDPPGARAALADIRALAGEAQVEMRALLTQLRPAPVATVGLLAALREQLSALAYRAEVAIAADLQPLPEALALPPGAEDALFRIAQEGLANISRHARAGQVALRFGLAPEAAPPQAELVLRDDGQGFAPGADDGGSGMGLHNMRARAAEIGGTLTVETAPGAGTTLTVRVPLARELASAIDREQEQLMTERISADLRRANLVRVIGSTVSVAWMWCFIALSIRPEVAGLSPLAWFRSPLSLGALALVALFVAVVGLSFRAERLARRFRAQIGDQPVWTLRLARVEHLAHTLEYGVSAVFLAIVVRVFFRGATDFVAFTDLAIWASVVGMAWLGLISLWRLIATERALSALAPNPEDRARRAAALTTQATNLCIYLVLLLVFSSFLRIQIPSEPQTFEGWLRATAAYPLLVLALVSAWDLAWNQYRLRQDPPVGRQGGGAAA